MSTSVLLKFVNPLTGPVISITSSPHPGFWRRWLWLSTARLHPKWVNSNRSLKVLTNCGGGWSSDKTQSQCKAVTEAIERWAFRYYSLHAPNEAGLDVDPTTNGFAALPSLVGEETVLMNAYCESLERWALSRMWDDRDIFFREASIENEKLRNLFADFNGHLHCFKAALMANNHDGLPPRVVYFYLCVFETDTGGAIPGSACGEDHQNTLERATLESYNHVIAYERMKKRQLALFTDIAEQRLYFFANHKNGYNMVKERIKQIADSKIHDTPKILLSKRLRGPWDPEVFVHRVLVKDSKLIKEGGVERFLI